nr:TonB-dependent receptor [Stenotrophomonas maltophilia]
MRAPRRWTHGGCLALLLPLSGTVHAVDGLPRVQRAIAAQPLDIALQQLSLQTGLQFVYDPGRIGNPDSAPVAAGTAVADALPTLLRGTGLRFQQLDANTITLQTDAPGPALIRGTDPVTVQPSPATLATVRVAGYQHDIARAVELKHQGALLGDSLVSSEIASFPDTNLAESLQRLPGVAITREAGEGRQVTLRGLGPEFTRVRINGMDVLSTNAGIDSHGGINRTRGFDFNVFPSDIFERIAVIRNRDAAEGEGGIAGTIELRTPRPFDQPGRRLSFATGGLYQDNSGQTSPRVAALASDTWFDGRLGGLLSAAYSEQDTLEFGHSTVRWASGGWNLGNVAPTIDPAIVARLNSSADDALFYPRFNRYDVYQHQRRRLGVSAGLQLQASDSVQIYLDALAGQLRSTRAEYHLDASAFSRNNAEGLYNTGLREITVKALDVEGNDIVHGEYGNVDLRSDTHQNRSSTRYRQLVVGMQRDGEGLQLEASLGLQSSRFDNPQDDNVFLFAQNRDFSIDYRDQGRVPVMRYGINVADAESWFLDTVRVRHGGTAFLTRSARLVLRYPLAHDLSLSGGLEARSQTFDSRYWSTDYSDARFRTVGDLAQPLPYDFAAGMGRASLPAQWSVVRPRRVEDVLGMRQRHPTLDAGASWQVSEAPLAAWLQLDIDTPVAGRRWQGSLGVRPSRTRSSTSGYLDKGEGLARTRLRQHQSEVLPSFNSRLQLAPDVVWRLSSQRDASRPPLAELAPNGSVDSLNRQVSSGNPGLSPIRATAVDTALEWYLGDDGVLAATAFYKDIDGFVVSTVSRARYQESGYSLALLDPAVVTPDQVFTFSRPENGRGTHLRGTELSWQQRWGSIGMQLNHTWADARVRVTGADGQTHAARLPGLSRHTLNATLLWERGPLSIRTSATWRDGYLTAVPGGNGNDVAGVNASLYVDAAVRLRLARGWTLQLEASNLTREVDDQYVDSSNRVYHYARAGWQSFVGLRADL